MSAWRCLGARHDYELELDDTVIEGLMGAQRITAALKKHGIILKDRVITS
jgi:hypothetical protein